MKKLRFAQAGPTMIHANSYRDTLMLLPDELELVGFYDPDPDAVRPKLKPNAQDVPFYGSISELIEKARPDAVMVQGYLNEMPNAMLQVVEAGVHLWAEKPFATHSSQLKPVAEVMAKKNLAFSCGYSWRFNPYSQIIKKAYDDGLLGKPYSLEMRHLTSSVKRRNPNNWTFKKEITGGGILNWLGCHWIDLMRYLSSSEVVKVSSIEANVSGEAINVEDAAAVSFQWANGMIGSLHTGFFTPGGDEISIGFRGAKGWAKWDIDEQSCTIRSTDPSWETAPTRKFSFTPTEVGGYGAEGLALIKAFCAAIRGEGSSGYTIQDAIKSLQIIEAAHESAATGKAITLAG